MSYHKTFSSRQTLRTLAAAALIGLFATAPVMGQQTIAPIPTAEFFNSLSNAQIAGYFTQLTPEQLAGFFQQMDQGALMQVIGKLGDDGVKAVIGQLPPEVVQGFIDNMTPETYMGFVAGIKDPELLTSLGFDDAASRDTYLFENLNTVDPALAKQLFGQILLNTDDADLQQAILESTGDSDELAFFLSMTPEERSAFIAQLDPNEVQGLLSQVDDLRTFFQDVDPAALADGLEQASDDDIEAYLAGIDPEALDDVLAEVDVLSELESLLTDYADVLEAAGVNTADLDDDVTALQEAQTALAEEYDVDFDVLEDDGAAFIAETDDDTSTDDTSNTSNNDSNNTSNDDTNAGGDAGGGDAGSTDDDADGDDAGEGEGGDDAGEGSDG